VVQLSEERGLGADGTVCYIQYMYLPCGLCAAFLFSRKRRYTAGRRAVLRWEVGSSSALDGMCGGVTSLARTGAMRGGHA